MYIYIYICISIYIYIIYNIDILRGPRSEKPYSAWFGSSIFKATRRAVNLKRGPGKSGAAGRLTPGNQSKGKGNATTKEDEQNRWRKASKKRERRRVWWWHAGRKQARVQTPFETRPWVQRYTRWTHDAFCVSLPRPPPRSRLLWCYKVQTGYAGPLINLQVKRGRWSRPRARFPANSHVLQGRHGAAPVIYKECACALSSNCWKFPRFKGQGGAAPVIYKDFALLLGLDRAPRYDPWQINCKSISATF